MTDKVVNVTYPVCVIYDTHLLLDITCLERFLVFMTF